MNDLDKQETILADIWWLVILRGLTLMLLGLALIFYPGITLATIMLFLGVYIFLDGIYQIIEGISSRNRSEHWVLATALGALEIAVGLFIVMNLETAILTLAIIISITFIIRGLVDIARGIKGYGENSRVLITLAGLAAIAVGVILLFNPLSLVVLLWIYGIFALIAGPLLIAIGINLRSALNSKE